MVGGYSHERMRLAVGLIVLAVAAPAWGWGCDAHRIVALIAWARLGERARAETTALLTAHPIGEGERGCNPPSRNVLADVGMWADAIRDGAPATAPWHYVNVALDGERSDLARACPLGDCVTKALARQLDVLRAPAPAAERARALRFVVHLVGDLHQPMHVATNGDRGGNCLPVAWFDDVPQVDRAGERWNPNLHAVWDTRLVKAVLDRAHATPSEYADDLRRRFAGEIDGWQRLEPSIDDWAWEAHEIGVAVAYGKLPRRVPIAPHVRLDTCRANRDVGRRMAALGIRLDDAYVDAARSALDEQLAKAGARLAAVLDRALDSHTVRGLKHTP
jgi:hypothetical protein